MGNGHSLLWAMGPLRRPQIISPEDTRQVWHLPSAPLSHWLRVNPGSMNSPTLCAVLVHRPRHLLVAPLVLGKPQDGSEDMGHEWDTISVKWAGACTNLAEIRGEVSSSELGHQRCLLWTSGNAPGWGLQFGRLRLRRQAVNRNTGLTHWWDVEDQGQVARALRSMWINGHAAS